MKINRYLIVYLCFNLNLNGFLVVITAMKLERKKILIIDDEEFFLTLLKKKIQEIDSELEIHTVESIDEALELMAVTNYSCVLCDHKFPGEIILDNEKVAANGVNFIRKLKELVHENLNYDVPVSLITGHGSEELAQKAIKEGASRYFSKRYYPGYFKNLSSSIREIITAFEMKKELKRGKQRFETVINNIDMGILISDLDHNAIYINDKVTEIIGYTADEIIGTTLSNYMPENDFKNLVGQTEQRLVNGKSTTYDVCFNHKNGEKIQTKIKGAVIYDETGKITETYGFITDPRYNKDQEEQLKEAWGMYRVLFESAKDAIFLLREYKFINCNQVACDLLNLTKEEIVGKNFQDLLSDLVDDSSNSNSINISKKFEEAVIGIPQIFTASFISKHGEIHDLEIMLMLNSIDNDSFFQAIVRQISR